MSRLRLALVFVAAIAVYGSLGAVPGGATEARLRVGCRVIGNAPVGDARRVYAIPHGCVWIFRPATRRTTPVVLVRIRGRTRAHAFPRAPLGKARGVCRVSGFVVDWPVVTVTAASLWYDVSGRPRCRANPAAAAIWISYYRYDRNGFVPLFVSHPRGAY